MNIIRDIGHAARTLRATPLFSITVIATLGVAMTLCTAVAVVVNAYLYTQLPYPNAERLHWVRYGTQPQNQPRDMERLDWQSLDDVIEHPIAWDLDMFYVLGGENAEAVPGAWVTTGFVEGLGIEPAEGRGFDNRAFERGSDNVVLISHRFARSRFGGVSPIGQHFTAYVSDRPDEAETFTVIGVLPEHFWHFNPYTDILAPLRSPTYPYMVRLREGVSPEQAAARISSMVTAAASQVPEGWAAVVESTREQYVRRIRPMLRSVMAAAVLLLLVGCANVSGLLLLRGRQRAKEIAVRSALGASRGDIARLLLAEALILGVAAIAIALATTRLILTTVAPLVQRQMLVPAPGGNLAFQMDLTLVAGVIAVGLAVTLVCALSPLAVTLRPELVTALQISDRAATEGRSSRRIRAGLIAVEIAASLALLAGSALMVRTVVSLLNVDLGIAADRVLLASITLRQSRYPDDASRLALYDRTLQRIGEIGGVDASALVSSWPLQQAPPIPIEAKMPMHVAARAAVHAVSSEYFTVLDIPIAAGRAFDPTDRSGSELVAVVSESVARRLWPGASALGQQLFIAQQTREQQPLMLARRVVGVVRDVQQEPADVDRADVYVPLMQTPGRFVVALVRTAGPPEPSLPALRAAFRDIDREISLSRARPLQTIVDEMRARPRFLSWLLSAFAMMAAFVTTVGVYGMIAYAVRQREREIAIRMAVGARPQQVVGLFVREGAAVLAVGLALGTGAAIIAGRLLESQLFGVNAGDPTSIAAALVLFALAGTIAVWWPSRRAASTDPAQALR